jgi:hypothetical protein
MNADRPVEDDKMAHSRCIQEPSSRLPVVTAVILGLTGLALGAAAWAVQLQQEKSTDLRTAEHLRRRA